MPILIPPTLIFHTNHYTDLSEHLVHIKETDRQEFDTSTHDPEKEVISIQIEKYGCLEYHTLWSVLSALKKSTAASLIDIGGYIGMYCLHAALYCRSAVAFEPFELNHEKFCQSIFQNSGFRDRIKLVAGALTNDQHIKYVYFNKAQFKIAVYKRNIGQTNLGSMQVSNGIKSMPTGDLVGKDYATAFTIDSLQEDKGILPMPGSHVILKVDGEGSECRALSGAYDYLSKVHIDYIALEWTPDHMKEYQEDGIINKIYDLFAKNGLEAYKLVEKDGMAEWIKVDLKNSESWAKGMFDMALSKQGIPSFDIGV
eukprot:scaffold421357_cov86-Attheya_sp.AAC.1